ncbi:DUF6114 domain-containing protein [Streptomyces sp. NPDC051018]|uniref:DUF6114 domain-containing protein n=1 Tax=Streptomyces sp. NPDC051018 TaxID=3365639 RepID=UPI0037BCDE69
MSADSMATGRNDHLLRLIRRFRDWRGQRPFWAGLFTLLGGIPIAYFPYATFQLGHTTLSLSTTAGAGSLIIGVLLVTLGLTMWFHHIVRVFAGVASILLALVSLPVANLGGFIVGFLLAMFGGALAISWMPGEPLPAPAEATAATAPVAAPEPPNAPATAPARVTAPEPTEAGQPAQGDSRDVKTQESTIESDGGRNSAG